MGILDDLAMGFGLKARTQDYDARTARNIALSNDPSVRNARNQQDRTMAMSKLYARGDDFAQNAVTRDRQAQSFLQRQGGEGYNPSIIGNDDRPLYQRALFSPQGQLSPKPYSIGPVQLDGPLRIPGILGMITGGLFGQRDREVPTVSADGGAMRVRPPLDAGLNRFESQGARSHRAAMAAGYPTPDLSPRDKNYMMDTAPQYTGAKDYALGYGIDSPLLDFQPNTADLMESHIPLTSDAGDAEYQAFVEAARQDPLYSGVIDNPEAMRNIFNMYKEQMGE